MKRSCKVCGYKGLGKSWTEVTITPAGKSDRIHTYCTECATRYLDTLDMYGMTLALVKGIRTSHVAA
jgi:hypothetical protein